MSRSSNSRSSKNAKPPRAPRRGTRLLSRLTAAAVLAAAAPLAAALLPAPARAAGFVYQQHTLNAAVLVNGTDPAPYLFYVLNNRPDVRPTDLNLVNPMAPVGTDPSMKAYWEVSLNNASDSELAQYDVLYLSDNGISFGPAINEKLRRFVDNGGQLIVEYSGAAAPHGLFTGTSAAAGTGTSLGFPSFVTPAAPPYLVQPVVSQPYLLTFSDLASFLLPTPAYPAPSGPVQFSLGVNGNDLVHASEFTSNFSSALNNSNGGSVVSTAQIGAGQVVASTLNLGSGISVHNAATFAAADLYAAPAADLKLLANILNWAEAHPSENKTSHGNASSTGLASFSPAWQYLPMTAGTAAPSGAAVWGNFVFAVGADGFLRAFDAYPAENLTGGATADDGSIADYSTGTSYDEIWEQGSFGGASTPTVAAFGGVNYVFVEKQDGTVAAFNAVTGTGPTAFTLTGSGGGPFSGPAPGPTFYDGRLYAGQADGTLHVYDLNQVPNSGNVNVAAAVVPLNPNAQSGTSDSVTAAPSVGTLADDDTNVLVAIVPTTLNVYTVLLGGRNEPLIPFNVNGTLAGYSINRLGRYDLSNIFADVGYPSLLAYDNGGNVSGVKPNTTAPNPQDPLFAITNNAGYYTDWNMDFLNATGASTGVSTPNQVNINFISAASYGELQNNQPGGAVMSAAAIDRHGDYYYTETLGNNSYLVGVTNAPLYSRVHLKFRFRLPTTADNSDWNYVDGDNVNYNDKADGESLVDYHFVGAPVIDDQDNVYAAATNGTLVTVLCFRGDQPISATLPAGSTLDLTSETIMQTDEGGGAANTIQRGPDTGIGTANATYGQFIAVPPATDLLGNVTAPSSLQFYNFGKQGLTIRQIAGNLTEPQPITATSTDGTNTTTILPMQTNLAWFEKPFPLYSVASANGGASAVSSVAGLVQVGSSLLLTDGVSLYRLPSNPQVGANKAVTTPPSQTPVGVDNGVAANAGLGAVASVPSVGGSVMVINGANGLAARTRQVTVIADSGRVLGVDGDGDAAWAVDATTHTDTTSGTSISTKVPFSHPTALSQFALNDYLVADTGNNRCVRFDSAGNVQWELTRFQDPNSLLGAGQPLTLNQPASVVVRTFPDTAITSGGTTLANPGGSYNYYLVADSGHNRIVEVEDRVKSDGSIFVDTVNNNAVINHVLTWASHTGDQGGRSYRYGSATYYKNTAIPSGLSIAATVTNLRLARLATNPTTGVVTGLGATSGDAPGGSIVVFNYPLTPVPFNNLANAPVDLVYTTAGFYAASGTGSSTIYTPFTIRNPRFLQLATPSAAYTMSAPVSDPLNPNNVPVFDFLYADDNGAFDLTYDTNKGAFVAGADRLQFKASDYDAMTTPIDAATTTGVPSTGYNRSGLPFIATCVQALSTDSQTTSGTPGGTGGSAATVTRRYLITQNYSQGELGNTNATGKIGGEVFEIDVSAPVQYPAVTVAGTVPPPTVTGAPKVTAPGGFGSESTLSHPALTGPLTQPTYAVRLP